MPHAGWQSDASVCLALPSVRGKIPCAISTAGRLRPAWKDLFARVLVDGESSTPRPAARCGRHDSYRCTLIDNADALETHHHGSGDQFFRRQAGAYNTT